MFRFLQKGSYMSRNRGLLIYLEALIQRGKIGINAARQLRSYASGGHSSYQCLTNVDNRLRNKCAMTWNSDMEENNFTDMVYSLFTTHHSLKSAGATHVAHWNNSRKIAFTLAEVLITLGIIGVVAAMTMPSLITNYRVKETVSKLKKVNTTFNNAFLQAKEENGEISDWGLSNSTLDTDTDDGSIANSNYGRDKFLEILSRHLKTISMCKYSDNSCEVYRPTNLQGDIDNSDSYSNRLVLADGTIIGHLYLNNTACNTNWGSGALSQSCGSFKVDLNGSKKPNMYGKDIFQFDITVNGIVPSGIATDISGNNFEESCIKSASRMNGVGCTGWVIYNENMDYLKCPEKLGWNKAKSCK